LFILLPVTALVLALLDYIGAADPQQKLSYLIDSYGFFVFQNVAMQGKAVFKIHNFKKNLNLNGIEFGEVVGIFRTSTAI